MEMSPHYRDRGMKKHHSGKAKNNAGAQNYESDNRRADRDYRRKTDPNLKYYDDGREHGISAKKYRGTTPQHGYDKKKGDKKRQRCKETIYRRVIDRCGQDD